MMTDETTSDEVMTADADATADDGRRERNRLDRRNADLAKKLKAATERLTQFEQAESEREAAAQEAADKAARAAGEWEKLEKKLLKQVESAQAETAELKEQIATHERLGRESALLERLAAVSNVSNKTRLRALLREAAATRGVEAAPDELTDEHVKQVLAELREMDPETFDASRSVGPSHGVAGTNRPDSIKALYDLAEKQGRLSTDHKDDLARQIIEARQKK